MSFLFKFFLFLSLCHFLYCISLCHPENEYACKNGTCISVDWLCDNIHDCLEGEDENDCVYLHECPKNFYMCRSGECLSKNVKCDGHFDCSDSSDEKNCINIVFPVNDSDDDNFVTFWVYMLWVILSLIVISSICIGFNYCLFKPRHSYQIENNLQMVVIEDDDERHTV